MPDELTQKLGLDASAALNALTQLNKAYAENAKAVRDLSGAYRGFNTSSKPTLTLFEKFNQGFQSTAKQSDVASNTIGRSSQRLARSMRRDMGISVGETERLRTSLGLLSRVVFTQFIVRALSQVRASLRQTTDDAIAFQQSLALISTIDNSNQSLQSLGASTKTISDQFNIPLLEVTAGLYQTISNQVGTTAESLKFLDDTAKLARATNSTLADSVDLVSGAIKSFNLDVEDTDRVTSVFFKTIDLGRIEADELANSFGQVGPIAGQLGLTLEETGAALAAITVSGTNTSKALTSFSNILTALQKPSDAMVATLNDLGFASGETALRTLGLSGTLETLVKSTNGSNAQLAKLFPNIRSLRGISSLTADDLETLADNIRETEQAGRDFNDSRFQKILETDAEKVTSALNKLTNEITTGIGQELLSLGKDFLTVTGGIENTIAVTKAFGPVLVTATGLLGAYSAAALAGARSNATFAASFPGVAQGLLLAGGAIAGGRFLGDQLIKNIQAPRKEFERTFNQALEQTKKFNANRLQELETADRQRIQQLLQANQTLNKAYQQDVQNAQNANDLLVASTKRAAAEIIKAQADKVSATQKAIQQTQSILESSQDRILSIQDRRASSRFESGLEGLSEARQQIKLAREAQKIAQQAARTLKDAASAGDQSGIQRALGLFSRAEQLAQRSGRDSTLERVFDAQLRAEQQLQSISKAREPQLQAELSAQQQILETLRQQKQTLEASLGDVTRRRAALESLFGADGAAIEKQFQGIQQQIDIASKLFAGQTQGGQLQALGFEADNPEKLAQALADAAVEAQALRKGFTSLGENARQAQALRIQIEGIVKASEGSTRNLLTLFGVNTDTVSETNANIAAVQQGLRDLANDANITREELRAVLEPLGELNQNRLNVGIGTNVTEFSEALQAAIRLQQIQQQTLNNPAANANAQQRLQQLESVIGSLRADPMTSMVQSSATIEANLKSGAAAMVQAAQAAAQAAAAQPNAHGGRIAGLPHYFAHGGRGTDTVNALLSPGEFVVNKKAAQQFAPQLHAINSGMQPKFSGGGEVGATSTTIGDISVNLHPVKPNSISSQEAKQIGRKIQNEVRRGILKGFK